MKTQQKRTRKRHGGSAEAIFRRYAAQIKKQETIDVDKFEEFLKSQTNPLMMAYNFDNDKYKYTIAEYAIMHGNLYGSNLNEFDLHAKFRDHNVDLNRMVIYPNFNIYEPLNLLEAYIYDGKHVEMIRCIMHQYEPLNYPALYFRKLDASNGIPSVLYFSFESSNYVYKPLDSIIYNAIINVYMHPKIYPYLIQNNQRNIMNLLSIAIQYNKSDLMTNICKKMGNVETVYSYIFSQRIMSYLLLQNNNELFDSAFKLVKDIGLADGLMQYIEKIGIDPTKEATAIIKKYLNFRYIPSNDESKRFFEILGLHILQDTLPPYVGETVRIIIRCHGSMLNDATQTITYPFNRLCYFVEKGTYLIETCHVSNRIENMVCNGNYDSSLKCISSVDGMIEIETMQFSFDAGFYKGNKHNYTGIYVCQNAKVDRVNEFVIDYDKKYSFPEIIEIVQTICDSRQIIYSNVDIMVFACRAKLGHTNPPRMQIHPKITSTPNPVTPKHINVTRSP